MEKSKISRDDVKHVAILARLNLSDPEIEILTRQLDSILAYVDKLNELDTSGVEPMSHVSDVSNAFRKDMSQESFPQALAVENAPEKEGGFFKVPRIMED
jgi:aspartyl-tRNA(Asn)/glutamyl-tRNA(Gln) amidotransferase subunit C